MPRKAQDGPQLFASPGFDGFGPSRFHPNNELPGGFRIDGRGARLGRSVKENAPKRPGVYAMLDPRGRIIYIGKAKCLRTRLSCYFRTCSRDPKAGRIIRHARALLWEHSADELSALLRELELIQRYLPRFNVLGLPGLRRYCFIALGRPDAPKVSVTREPSKNDMAVYGPFVGRARVEEAVRRLNDIHGLRDCATNFPMMFADSPVLFDSERAAGCLRYELGTCLGPCGGGCTRRKYHAAIRNVRKFLDGDDHALLDKLRTQMANAASEQRYEKAIGLRDKLADLEWLELRLALLRRSRHESAFVYPVDTGGRTLWYLLNRGRVWGTIWAPISPAEIDFTIATLHQMLSETQNSPVTVTSVDSVLLLLAWFRKYSQEKAKLLPAEVVLTGLKSSNAA